MKAWDTGYLGTMRQELLRVKSAVAEKAKLIEELKEYQRISRVAILQHEGGLEALKNLQEWLQDEVAAKQEEKSDGLQGRVHSGA